MWHWQDRRDTLSVNWRIAPARESRSKSACFLSTLLQRQRNTLAANGGSRLLHGILAIEHKPLCAAQTIRILLGSRTLSGHRDQTHLAPAQMDKLLLLSAMASAKSLNAMQLVSTIPSVHVGRPAPTEGTAPERLVVIGKPRPELRNGFGHSNENIVVRKSHGGAIKGIQTFLLARPRSSSVSAEAQVDRGCSNHNSVLAGMRTHLLHLHYRLRSSVAAF